MGLTDVGEICVIDPWDMSVPCDVIMACACDISGGGVGNIIAVFPGSIIIFFFRRNYNSKE